MSKELTPRLRRWLLRNYPQLADHADDEIVLMAVATRARREGRLTDEVYERLTEGGTKMSTTPEKVYARVKGPSERWSAKRYEARHAKTGQRVFNPFTRSYCEQPSQLDLARAGVLLKLSAKRSGLSVEMPEHERELLAEMVECESWADFNGDPHVNKVYAPGAVKALLDDSTSGGLEVAPIAFDSDLVTSPLLSAELFPLVDLKPVSRGRRVEAASMSTPTVSWGGGDGSQASLFNTNSMISAIDTTIHVCDCFVEVGRDFLSDAAIDVGAELMGVVGERFAAELDRVVAVGNGTSQPQGVMNASGTGSVSSTNGGAGPPTVSDYESLLFGVAKQYRSAGLNPVFVANETTYQRARGIAVSGSDQRRVFGMTHEDYSLLNRPYRISANMTNSQAFFGAMKKFRMYRRLGVSMEWSTQGKELMRNNLALLAVRMRVGGQVVDGSGFAVCTDMQS